MLTMQREQVAAAQSQISHRNTGRLDGSFELTGSCSVSYISNKRPAAIGHTAVEITVVVHQHNVHFVRHMYLPLLNC